MRWLLIALLISLCLISCKSPQKSVSGSKLNQEMNISNDISLTDDTRLSELTDQVIKRMINERLNVGIKQTKYDTDKPMVKETGRHPIVEEIELSISKETEVHETDSIRQTADRTSTVELNDHSEINTKIKAETKEEKETGLRKWQTVLITIGGLVVFGFVVFIIIRIVGIARR